MYTLLVHSWTSLLSRVGELGPPCNVFLFQDAIAKGHSYYGMFKRKFGIQYEE